MKQVLRNDGSQLIGLPLPQKKALMAELICDALDDATGRRVVRQSWENTELFSKDRPLLHKKIPQHYKGVKPMQSNRKGIPKIAGKIITTQEMVDEIEAWEATVREKKEKKEKKKKEKLEKDNEDRSTMASSSSSPSSSLTQLIPKPKKRKRSERPDIIQKRKEKKKEMRKKRERDRLEIDPPQRNLRLGRGKKITTEKDPYLYGLAMDSDSEDTITEDEDDEDDEGDEDNEDDEYYEELSTDSEDTIEEDEDEDDEDFEVKDCVLGINCRYEQEMVF